MKELKGVVENKPLFAVIKVPELRFKVLNQKGEKIAVRYENYAASIFKDVIKGRYVKLCGNYIDEKTFNAETIVLI